MFAINLHPKSEGEIILQSSYPLVPPLIDPKYLHDESDVDVLVEGTKIIENIMNSPQMQKYNAQHYEGVLPACAKYDQWSAEYIRCLARSRSMTVFHPVSTCRMGVSTADSVVDSELR